MFIEVKTKLERENHQVSDKSNNAAKAAPDASVGITGVNHWGLVHKHTRDFSFEYLKCNLGCVWIFQDAFADLEECGPLRERL